MPIPVLLGRAPDPPDDTATGEADRLRARLQAELNERGAITKAEVTAILADQPDPTPPLIQG